MSAGKKKEGKKTMSTKDVSCLAAPWVNSEPCGGVVLPGAPTHHVCVGVAGPQPVAALGGGQRTRQHLHSACAKAVWPGTPTELP